LYSKTELLI